MSKNNPSEPVCLYDRMAASAAVEAGYPSPLISDTSTPTEIIVAVSVVSTLIVGVFVNVIMRFIIQRRRTNRHEEGIEMQLTGNSAPPS
jgi:hypothetical protein